MKKHYLCIVFFMVLDLRLTKRLVVEMTTFFFFIGFCCKKNEKHDAFYDFW